MTMMKDQNLAAWRRELTPKKSPKRPDPRARPVEHAKDDDSSKTEDLIHRMYL